MRCPAQPSGPARPSWGNACVPGGYDGRQAQAHRWHRVVAVAVAARGKSIKFNQQTNNSKRRAPQSDKHASHLQAQRSDPPRWGADRVQRRTFINHRSPNESPALVSTKTKESKPAAGFKAGLTAHTPTIQCISKCRLQSRDGEPVQVDTTVLHQAKERFANTKSAHQGVSTGGILPPVSLRDNCSSSVLWLGINDANCYMPR